jgi:Ca2+-binding RTX toxin-like protein
MARYQGTKGNDQIVGAAEDNYFYDFGIWRDVLTGAGKSDVFYLTVDAITDIVDGRDGNDTIDYSGADRAVRIDLRIGSVTATFHDQQPVAQVQNIENATGSIYDDTIYGTDGNNTLDGNAGDDYLYGRDGNDTLLGGAGADHLYGGDQDDTLIGGTGNDYINGGAGLGDTVSYADVDRGVGVDVDFRDQASSDTPHQARFYGGAGAETDTVGYVENAIGTKYGDRFEGGVEANVFDGADGNDSIWGFGGEDTLKGGAGDDHLNGGQGADRLIGGDGSDWVEYNGLIAASDQPNGNVIISLFDPTTNTWEAKGDSYDSIENIIGSPFNDIITGDDHDNIIIDRDDDGHTIGGAYRPDGYNYFYGLGGRDTFVGSVWHPDYFYGGNEEDTVDYSGLGFAPAVTIDLEHQALNDGVALGDRFYFVEDIVGTDLGDDTIYGNFANNTFHGGGGDDRLMGRGGDDTLIGDRGTDTAVFSGNFADYTFRTLHFNDGERFLEVHDTRADRDGTDYVIQVEHLEFHNSTVNTSDLL